jgi:N-acetylglucosaminyldiphosphoundecaprenol N-acetyl-beta-D-mannosaminyltransferase
MAQKMEKYFNINYEFDQKKVDEIIFNQIESKKPGYVCSLDGTNLSIAQKKSEHLRILNEAIVNNCDSTWVPFFINLIYGTEFTNYYGMDLFTKYVRMKRFRQFFLGSTPEVLQKLKEKLLITDPKISEMRFESLPFQSVEDFDYSQIGEMINRDEPDIIWVSLGAPKQEKFMSLLLPYLNKGVMFGFGAIFNMYAEMPNLKRAPQYIIKLKLEWFYRLLQEPRKQIGRVSLILRIIPKIIRDEIKSKREKELLRSNLSGI